MRISTKNRADTRVIDLVISIALSRLKDSVQFANEITEFARISDFHRKKERPSAQIPSNLTVCFSGRSSMSTKNVIISFLVLKPTGKIELLQLSVITLSQKSLETSSQIKHD